MSNSSACSVSLPLMRTGTARLPRLSTAVSNLPVKRERPVPGWSSAPSSTKLPTSTVPSPTAAPTGSSFGTALTAHVARPGLLDESRGGAIVTVTSASVSGNSLTVGGSTVIQGAASPSGWNENWSTTSPVLRTRSSVETDSPGWTASAVCWRDTEVPMGAREPRDVVERRVADVHGAIPFHATGFARKGNLRQNSVSRYLGVWPNLSDLCNCCCGDDVMLERAWTTPKSRK